MQTEAFLDFVVYADYTIPIGYLIVLMRESLAKIKSQGKCLGLKIDSDINEKNFQLSGEERETEQRVIALNFLPLHSDIGSERAIEEMGRQNCSPATIRDFLFFAACHPEIVAKYATTKHAIVILGSALVNKADVKNERCAGFKSIPYFIRRGNNFCLDLIWSGIKWHRGYRFLVEDKSAQLSCASY